MNTWQDNFFLCIKLAKIKKSLIKQCWYGEREILIYFRRECKLAQFLWKTYGNLVITVKILKWNKQSYLKLCIQQSPPTSMPVCSVASDSFVILWTVARQAPLSVEFPRQGDWSGLPPGDLSHPGIKPASAAVAGRFFIWATREAQQPVIRCRQVRHLCSLQAHLPASLCSLFNMDPQTQFLSTV